MHNKSLILRMRTGLIILLIVLNSSNARAQKCNCQVNVDYNLKKCISKDSNTMKCFELYNRVSYIHKISSLRIVNDDSIRSRIIKNEELIEELKRGSNLESFRQYNDYCNYLLQPIEIHADSIYFLKNIDLKDSIKILRLIVNKNSDFDSINCNYSQILAKGGNNQDFYNFNDTVLLALYKNREIVLNGMFYFTGISTILKHEFILETQGNKMSRTSSFDEGLKLYIRLLEIRNVRYEISRGKKVAYLKLGCCSSLTLNSENIEKAISNMIEGGTIEELIHF